MQRVVKRMPLVFSVDGNIGSGKSTIVNNLKKFVNTHNIYQNFVFLQEPVDVWNEVKNENGKTILEYFYADQKRHAFSFQMMAYISRLSQLKKAINDNPNSIIVTERSILTDKNVFAQMLHDDKQMTDIEHTIYMKWFDEFSQDVKLDGMIYVQTTPETAHERVQKRGRKGEDIPIEYLRKCHEYHDSWFSNIKNMPIHKLNCNMDTYHNKNVENEWIESILLFISLEKIKYVDLTNPIKNTNGCNCTDSYEQARWLTGC